MLRKNALLKVAGILIASLLLVTASAYALFSDFAEGSTGGTGGTVKLDKDIGLSITDVPEASGGTGKPGKEISNWNPGDANLIEWDVKNIGNKAADTRNSLILYWDTEPDLPEKGVILLYPADMSDEEILADAYSENPSKCIDMGSDDKEIQLEDGGSRKGIVYTFNGDILDGVGVGKETGVSHEVNYIDGDETDTSADHVRFKLVFSPKASAIYMSKPFVATVITEAKQFYNSTGDWTEVARESVGVQGLTTVPAAD